MQKFRDAEQIYDSCLADGLLKQSEEENTAKIKSLLENAAIHLSTADIVAKALHQNSKEQSADYYREDYYVYNIVYKKKKLTLTFHV